MITEKICMDIEVVGSGDGKETYEIRRRWREDGRKAIVIELYPTISCKNPMSLDVSTMHLLNHAGTEMDMGEIRIINLYPKVFRVKPTVAQLTQSVENLEYIRDIFTEDSIGEYDIVIAWGSSLATHDGTNHIKKELLKMIQEYGLEGQTKHIVTEFLDTEKQLGTHPLFLGLRHGAERWQLESYPVKFVLEGEVKESETEEKDADSMKKGRKGKSVKNGVAE